MKWIKNSFFFVPLLCLLFAAKGGAYDTDLYMASGSGVAPNILIMFDNSGSMNETVQAYYYDKTITYDPLVVPTGNSGTVYYQKSSGGWGLFANSIANVACSSARTALTNNGHYEGNTNSSCNSTSRTLQTGNYRNYLASIGGSEYKPKIDVAKDVIKDFLDTVSGVRVGVMVFNYEQGGKVQSSIKSLDDATRATLKNDIDDIEASTWTPLAETLYEAGLYFKGGASRFNSGVTYISPLQYSCQRNYVIIITDGQPTHDRDSILGSAVGDQDHDGREPGGAHEVSYADSGSDYLDDVAKYLYDRDLSSSFSGTQNIITYTIGFTITNSLLERTATQGHGKFYYCNNVQGLASAFQNILGQILSESTSFVAPIVPVSRMERTTAGDKIYLALFQPISSGMWSGNIKKFGVAQSESSGIHVGDIIDVNGNVALDSHGKFYSTAKSFWTAISMDGGEVQKGGVGEALMNRASARNIYTYLGTNADLTHSSNAFSLANAAITPALLGLGSDTDARDKLVKFVQGVDSYDDDGNGNTTEKRDWILGAFLHSRPLVINYKTRTVIFAGSNDGMLHAFDDADGTELWGFIPPDLLDELQALHGDVVMSFVDGSPKTYLTFDSNGDVNGAYLIFGERRGGNVYYALDVTNPMVPKFLWKISPSTNVGGTFPYAEMGQTWSAPLLGTIDDGTPNGKWVAFIGGGYDDNQDNNPVIAADTKGRAIYLVDVLDGSLVWRYSHAEDSTMTYSIPSDIARIDLDGDGKIDRLYVGDLGGRMWRFDIAGSDKTRWTGKIIFKSNPDGATDLRKIFYPPDVTLERDESGDYEQIFFGTGDREHPKETTIVNRLYAVKDKNLVDKTPPSPYVENDLVDVTSDLLQTGTDAQKTSTLSLIKTKSGWYITFDVNSGEKSLSPPVVFYKTVYYTTFSPTFGVETDPCYVGEGTARVYALNYSNGVSLFNFDVTNDVGGNPVISKSDRSKIIGTAIPSGVIVTFIGGQAVAYLGVGGGVFSPELKNTKSLVPVNWRIVF